ncbi:hypothetical protein HA402_003526 [Bradysia odoriphaga]|nr:hypothetical protein HA402_003526 [Bradysia odoriphaga]
MLGKSITEIVSSIAQSNLLCRSSPTTICAYLCFSMGSEFVTIQTQYDLVDFDVNGNRIWGLWCNAWGEYNISSYSFLSSIGDDGTATRSMHCGRKWMRPEADLLLVHISSEKISTKRHRSNVDLAIYTLVLVVKNIGQLVWAVSGNFIFGEWLLSSCQHILIQEYVQLLHRWCEWNSCSRHLILAVSMLENSEAHKAYDIFMKAASGVLTETFLEEIILTPSAEGITYNMALT